jgi:hypothetical protein
MQADPIGTAGGINLYAYVNNDPLNLLDPFGFAADSPSAVSAPSSSQNDAALAAPDTSPAITPSTFQAVNPAVSVGSGTSNSTNGADGNPQNSLQLVMMSEQERATLGGRPVIGEGGGGGGEGGGGILYVTPNGQVIVAPPGYQAVDAQNGNGLVLLPQGQALGNNSNIIRYGEPNAANPNGYFRYYNQYGQPLDPTTGKSGPNDLTHIDPSYQGPLMGYPK